jgi:hypothetical protein
VAVYIYYISECEVSCPMCIASSVSSAHLNEKYYDPFNMESIFPAKVRPRVNHFLKIPWSQQNPLT